MKTFAIIFFVLAIMASIAVITGHYQQIVVAVICLIAGFIFLPQKQKS
jgi:hypothetical protein